MPELDAQEPLSPGVRALVDGLDVDERAPAPSHPGKIIARWDLLFDDSARGGGSARARGAGVILHEPSVALLYASDFPPLARRRPSFASLRHVLMKFSFMLDELASKERYESAQLTVTLDAADARVLGQYPALVAADTDWRDTKTTEFSAALDSLVHLGAGHTRTTDKVGSSRQLPIVTAQNRGRAGFGWKYQAQEGAPLFSRIEYAMAVVEMPRELDRLSGHLTADAVITIPRRGIRTTLAVSPAQPPAPFGFDLGPAG
jgi:hypothetical protein